MDTDTAFGSAAENKVDVYTCKTWTTEAGEVIESKWEQMKPVTYCGVDDVFYVPGDAERTAIVPDFGKHWKTESIGRPYPSADAGAPVLYFFPTISYSLKNLNRDIGCSIFVDWAVPFPQTKVQLSLASAGIFGLLLCFVWESAVECAEDEDDKDGEGEAGVVVLDRRRLACLIVPAGLLAAYLYTNLTNGAFSRLRLRTIGNLRVKTRTK